MLRPFLKQNPLVIAVVFAVLLAGLFFWQRGSFPITTPETEKEAQAPEEAQPTPSENETAPQKRDAIADILDNVAALLVGGSKESVQRFWFAKNKGVYVEYQASQGMRMAYLEEQNGQWLRFALYGTGETGWEVMEGEDALFVNPQQELWEYNAVLQGWERKN